MSAVVDVRLVVQRNGRVRVVLEGRRVGIDGRDELAEAQDGASALYEGGAV